MKVFKFYPKMTQMLALIGIVGFIMGFKSSSLGVLIKLTVSSSDTKFINMRIGIGFILLGVGQIFGSTISGLQVDRIQIQTMGGIGISLFLITCQSALISYHTLNEYFVYVVSFLWGFIQSYIQSWIIVVCSRNYKGRSESFVINKQFHFLTMCIYQMLVIYGTKNFSILLYILLFLAVPCIMSLSMLKTEEEQKLEN